MLPVMIWAATRESLSSEFVATKYNSNNFAELHRQNRLLKFCILSICAFVMHTIRRQVIYFLVSRPIYMIIMMMVYFRPLDKRAY